MKIIFIPLLVCLSLNLNAQQTIVGTAHDFSEGYAWNTTGENCKVCHLPHNADEMSNAPLWNHQLTNANFKTYSSSTLDAIVGQPDGTSKLCLSCHDGTVALENFGGMASGSNFMNGTVMLGTDLSNDHPVSFVYDDALASIDGGLFLPSTSPSGLGRTIARDLLSSNKMQCTSCHDVHNGMPGVEFLLRKTDDAGELCLTCHKK